LIRTGVIKALYQVTESRMARCRWTKNMSISVTCVCGFHEASIGAESGIQVSQTLSPTTQQINSLQIPCTEMILAPSRFGASAIIGI
jgi:hypothetical protein